MSAETKTSIEIDGAPMPPHLMANFEKAEQKIRETYGTCPPKSELARLWLSTATSWRIQAEYERSFLSIKSGNVQPNKEGVFDESSFDF